MDLLEATTIKAQIKDLKSRISSYNRSQSILQSINQKLSYEVQVPINKVFFVEGKIKETNRIFVKTGDFMLERSAHDAQRMLKGKQQISENLLEAYQKQLRALKVEDAIPDIEREMLKEKEKDKLNQKEIDQQLKKEMKQQGQLIKDQNLMNEQVQIKEDDNEEEIEPFKIEEIISQEEFNRMELEKIKEEDDRKRKLLADKAFVDNKMKQCMIVEGASFFQNQQDNEGNKGNQQNHQNEQEIDQQNKGQNSKSNKDQQYPAQMSLEEKEKLQSLLRIVQSDNKAQMSKVLEPKQQPNNNSESAQMEVTDLSQLKVDHQSAETYLHILKKEKQQEAFNQSKAIRVTEQEVHKSSKVKSKGQTANQNQNKNKVVVREQESQQDEEPERQSLFRQRMMKRNQKQ